MHMQVHFRTQADDPSTKDERFLELQKLGLENKIQKHFYLNDSVSLVAFHTKDQVKADENLFNEQVMPGVEKEKELD